MAPKNPHFKIPRRRWWKHPLNWLKLGLVLLIIFATGWYLLFESGRPIAKVEPTSPPAQIQPKVSEISSRMLVFGNAFWGRYIHDWSQASPLKHAYPFSRLNEFGRENYDAWIAGLECPTASFADPSSAAQEETLSFNCRPEYLNQAKNWFTAFTLANNHTDNQGVEGFAETRQQLERQGIQHFGHYDPNLPAEACSVIILPAKAKLEDNKTKEAKIPVAMCGFHGVFAIPPAETIKQIEQYVGKIPVLAFPHMGAEYKPAPDQIKTSVYRQLIDAGADAVLGDHPHWIQSTEAYQGKLIVYSLGNFMFDQQYNTEVTRSAAVDLTLTYTGSTDDLTAWTTLVNECQAGADCWSKIQKSNLKRPEIRFDFSVLGTNNANKIVKPATEAELAGIKQRLNWSQTVTQLQAPYFAQD